MRKPIGPDNRNQKKLEQLCWHSDHSEKKTGLEREKKRERDESRQVYIKLNRGN